ncbi:hypothetical protein [Nostoc sp. C052]
MGCHGCHDDHGSNYPAL